MTSEPSYSVAVVCEASADQETACGLADRVLLRDVDWLDEGQLDDIRRYRGYQPSSTHLPWKGVRDRAKEQRIRVPHGRFGGEEAAPDAGAGRRALRLLMTADGPIDAVLLIRDADGQPERLRGLQQARDETTWDVRIVVGVANTMRECWVLNGLEPASSREQRALSSVQRELGFDPRTNAHRLTAKRKTANKSPKRVLHLLVGDDRDRERRCWTETPLDVLEQRGGPTGLRAYLSDASRRLSPLIGGSRASRPPRPSPSG